MADPNKPKPTLAAVRAAIDAGDWALAEELLAHMDPSNEVRELGVRVKQLSEPDRNSSA